MGSQRKSDKKQWLIVLTIALLVTFSKAALPDESPAYLNAGRIIQQTSPNYLIILVHGINSTRAAYMGKGENGSDISELSEDEKVKDSTSSDLKGYLENVLGLKGYVYAYTFSERDGHVELMAHELGDPNWDNNAIRIGGTLHHHPNGKDIEAKYTKITEGVIDGKGTGRGNSWTKQAREDFIIDFIKREKRPPTEAEIPHKYILVSHSLGGTSNNVHRISLSGLW